MMIVHYTKIAFRNMWKYKNQTLLSVLGLAVGFACFALATLWIVYEMTYDSFHKNAGQMYVIFNPDSFSPTGYSRKSPNPLAAHLKETFPEIADATPVTPYGPLSNKIRMEGVEYPALMILADSSFLRMFDVQLLEGSRDFLIPGSNKVAITHEKAQQLFGHENPIGKIINDGANEICAVVSEMSKHSNYAFDLIGSFRAQSVDPTQMWSVSYGENTIIELLPGTKIEVFEKKLYEYEANKGGITVTKMTIIPITKLRYTDTNINRDVQFQHIVIFAISGFLVVLCSLLNYLTLFVSRFRIRQKELALRVVCGASGRSLLSMLSVEFMLTLLFAVLMGYLMTQSFLKSFLTLSEIQMNIPAIYRESLLYIGGVILVSLLVFRLILSIFRRRSLNLSIRRTHKKMFRKMSVVCQLVISIGFAFCTIIMLKQIYFLHHANELGFSFKNRGSVMLWCDGVYSVLENQLKQIPEITEMVDAVGMQNLIPQWVQSGRGIVSWDDKPVDAGSIYFEIMNVTPEYTAFYDFQLLAGGMLTDADPASSVLINESAVKAFGWHDAIGKRFDQFTVKGVIKDVYNFAPTTQPKPTYYMKRPQEESRGQESSTVLFKYREGTWKACKEKIEQIIKKEFKEFTDLPFSGIFNSEEEYNKYLKSENALINLLSVVSAICVLICVFGFVSLVSLTCEERRKSIAIRKINGATVNDILTIFVKEYSLLLIVGATIAFPTAYLLMQRWLEQYVKQTNLPAWVYLSILSVLAMVIVICVGWQVYRASVENPAETIKNND